MALESLPGCKLTLSGLTHLPSPSLPLALLIPLYPTQMMQDCAPERVGPACSPLLGGPALQGAHNLAGIVRAHALQVLLCVCMCVWHVYTIYV